MSSKTASPGHSQFLDCQITPSTWKVLEATPIETFDWSVRAQRFLSSASCRSMADVARSDRSAYAESANVGVKTLSEVETHLRSLIEGRSEDKTLGGEDIESRILKWGEEGGTVPIPQSHWAYLCRELAGDPRVSRWIGDVAAEIGHPWPKPRHFVAISDFLTQDQTGILLRPGIGRSKLRTIVMCVVSIWKDARAKSSKEVSPIPPTPAPLVESAPDLSLSHEILPPASPLSVNEVVITAEMAAKLLAEYPPTRAPKKNQIALLASEMRNGRWKYNGDTISIGDGVLIDGLQRLHAVVASGVPIRAVLVTDVPKEVISTKGNGRIRSGGDTLACEGESQGRNLASALNAVEKFNTGKMNTGSVISNQRVLELFELHPSVARSLRVCQQTKKLLPRSILTACHYLFSQKDEQAADLLVRQLVSGSDLEAGDPVYVLREKLLQNSISKAKMKGPLIMALVIKAWNAVRKGQKVKTLRLDREEAYPTIY